MSLYLLDAICGLATLYFANELLADKLWRKTTNNYGAPLPPGPQPLPLIGNLLDMPKGNEGQHWAKLNDRYGPISALTAFGQVIIIVNDMDLAFELLEKKSFNYSDRPTLVFWGELCGMELSLPLVQNGDRCRTTRKLLHQFMGTRSSITQYEPLEELETRRFLLNTLRKPEKFMDHIRVMAGAVALKLAYGYNIERGGDDLLVDMAETSLARFAYSTQPGAWLVDVLPFLKNLPDWVPGTKFKKVGAQWKADNLEIVEKPFAFAKQQFASGNATPSFSSFSLEKGYTSDYEVELVKWAASLVYGGGSDTTVSVISTFILAMVLYPDVLRRAQTEIDAVVGTERLPTFTDRPNLPYVNAILKESLRWNVVTPTGAPHVASEEDICCGYFIPKGAIIIPNVWLFTHNPKVYPDPWKFKPERFLSENGHVPELDPHTIAFGFGRRICPGKELADASVFIALAMCIAVFNISKAKDANGKDIEPLYEYTSGTISHPKEFKCSIVARNAKAQRLIESIQDHPYEPGDAEKLRNVQL